jgi:hypothetical protein
MELLKKASCLVLASLIVACGGGGGGSSTTPVRDAAVGGIWQGTVTFTGQGTFNLIGLVAEDGRAHFIQEDGVQYWGTVRSTRSNISASITGAMPIGGTFADGSTSGTGSITGTIVERSRLTATSTFTTSAGLQTRGEISLTYDPLYDRDASLATIAGNYTNALAPGSDSLSVSGNGVIFGQVPANACVINGQVDVPNGSYNAYEVQFTYSNCVGAESFLNGATFSGIATLDNTVSPELAIAAAQGRVGTTLYSLILVYQRT